LLFQLPAAPVSACLCVHGYTSTGDTFFFTAESIIYDPQQNSFKKICEEIKIPATDEFQQRVLKHV